MGFRPSATGFELKKGAFYNFCKKAEVDSDNEYFFIIDEINRGNLSKIFGELFMLIENDKRGNTLQLLYSDEKFAVPKNEMCIRDRPDYELMSTLISAIQKLVIADVVKFSDEKIKATKQVVG